MYTEWSKKLAQKTNRIFLIEHSVYIDMWKKERHYYGCISQADQLNIFFEYVKIYRVFHFKLLSGHIFLDALYDI